LFDDELVEQNTVNSSKQEDNFENQNTEPVVLNFEDKEEIQAKEEENFEDDFVIIDLTKNEDEQEDSENLNVVEVQDAQEISFDETTEQFSLTFDMPIKNETTLSKSEAEDVVAVDELDEPKVIRHVLDENIDEIKVVTKTQEKVALDLDANDSDSGMIIEKRVESSINEVQEDITEVSQKSNPLDLPIAQLKESAPKRRATMKEFNYKFESLNNKIDDIEKEPAYKRAGLEVNDVDTSTKVSRSSLSIDSNNDLQIRKNNSFLHDNVD